MTTHNTHKSALTENEGVAQPQMVNAKGYVKKKDISVNTYVSEIQKGNRVFLSKAITLVESSNNQHQIIAEELIELCLPFSGNSIRVGVTGVPGVGKSTFIETLGSYLPILHLLFQLL